MARILFFFSNQWAFGRIHNDLIKVLYPEHHCDIFCWTNQLTASDVEYLNQKYDIVMTTLEGAHSLHTNFGVPYNKCVCVVHSYWDILTVLTSGALKPADFNRFLGYATICPLLANISFAYGIPRVPGILPIGAFTENYVKTPSPTLSKMGYFGKYERRLNDHAEPNANTDIKRGYLADEVARQSGVELVRQEKVHFLWSEGLYKSVDLVIFCSLTEGLPTIAVEAFAAGIPVLGTDTGIFAQMVAGGGGGVLPLAEDKFVTEAVEVIQALKENPALYQRVCAAALEEGKKHDWAVLKPIWLDYLQSL